MQRKTWFRVIGVAGLASVACLAQAARTAVPGTVNYIEGQVSVDGKVVASSQAQTGNLALAANQILGTDEGKAEVLLSPGVFVRIGSNGQIRMISPQLVDPRIEVLRGEAIVEADFLPKQVKLDVLERGAETAVLKEGLYRFDADEGKIAVVDGKAAVTDNGQTKNLGKGKETVLTGAPLKAVRFDPNSEDDLYRWSSVRDSYLAQANQSGASNVYMYGYGAGWGPGWFWDPYFSMYSWLPGDGFFYSPFGYPFFSPGFIGYAGFGGYYGRGGFVGRGGLAGRTARGGFRPMGGVGTMRGGMGGGFHAIGGMRGGGGRR